MAVPAIAFTLLARAATSGRGAPFAVDESLHQWSVDHRPAWAAALFRLLTATGTGVVPYVVVLLAGWVACDRAASRRHRAAATAACLLTLALSQVVRGTLMGVLARPRPPIADRVTRATGFAFPSGHSTTSAIAAGLLAWAALRVLDRTTGRVCAALVAGWAMAVGASRVYLGVHWPSDVLGGWLLAAAWLALAVPLLSGFADRCGADRVSAPRREPDGASP